MVKNVFEDLLYEYDQSKSLDENHHIQTNTFKRLAFVVFSDSDDKDKMNQNNYNLLRSKMIQIFQRKDKPIELTKQMFLLMRILLLRLDGEQLTKDMALLWPYILTEFDSLFDSEYLIGKT